MKKNDLKDRMKGGLDSLIQPTAATEEKGSSAQSKENEIVRCSLVMERKYHKKMKMIAVEESKSLQDVVKEALELFFEHKESTKD